MMPRLKVLYRPLAAIAIVVVTGMSAGADTPAARLEGRPAFSEGDALGYFVWREGDTWKVRWTTFGAQHRFTGRVAVEGGEIRAFKRVDVDTESRVIRPGRPGRLVRGPGGRVRGVTGRPPVVATRPEDRMEQETQHLIRFATATDDDLDGFDFKVTGDARALRFVLEIDGSPKPGEVEIGRGNFKPAEHPLVVRLK